MKKNRKRKPTKEGGYTVNVSFTENEKNLLDYVDSKGSFSSYIKYLIRFDMETSLIGLKSAIAEPSKGESITTDEKIDDKTAMAIDNILEM